MKIGLVELVPNKTHLTVRANGPRSKMTATFIQEAAASLIEVRSDRNGGLYIVAITDVDVPLLRKRFKARHG